MNKKRHNKDNLLLFMAGGIFVICGIWLGVIWSGYKAGENEYIQIQEQAVSSRNQKADNVFGMEEGKTGEPVDLGDYVVKDIDFDGLTAENGDTVGWVEMPGLEVSYPVVQTTDNEYYLKRSFRKETSRSGSIFMDTRNDPELSDRNTIIYGHNMKNGSMFGKLKHYREEGFLEENPVFYYYRPGHVYQCQIISCRSVGAVTEEYPVGFSDSKDFMEYLESIKGKSWYDSGVEAKENDRLIMLSTCMGKSNERFIIQARVVELCTFHK